ncbi:MAG: hypothetical protein ACREQL_09910, partial [Candidatus Binatia bacterium]
LSRMLRAQLTLRGQVGGPFESQNPGILSLVHEFPDTTPSLGFNEAFAELRTGDLQVRAGIQKFAWGKLDGQPPTDVLSPRDLHDPIVRDYEESKIGIPALQATYFLPPVPSFDLTELRASLVYIPWAVPSRLALADERWFPPSISARELIPERQAERLVNGVLQEIDPGAPPIDLDGPVRVPFTVRTRNAAPPKTFDAGGIAFRLAGTWREMDWSLSHYTGPDTGPNASLSAEAFCHDCVATLPAGQLAIRARSVLRQEHDVMHMTGADWSAVLAGATARAEVAVFQNRPYLAITRDLIADALQPAQVAKYGPPLIVKGHARVPLGELFPRRNSVEWGVGADYLIQGFLPLLQVGQVIFTDSGPPQLLSNPETRLIGSIRRRFLQDTLEAEVRGVYAFERRAWFVFPRITYRLGDNWRLRTGYLGIGGPLDSYIGQFHANDEFVFEARYSF